MATNPLIEARKKSGLSRVMLAQASGLGYARIAAAEAGYSSTIGQSITDTLSQHGVDTSDLEDAYRRWRFDQVQGRQAG